MNVSLWILQALLAALFGLAGIMKATQPKDDLAEKLPWVADVSTMTVRFIGIVEVAAALGLILPAVTGIAPRLTPLAAMGLAVIMILASHTHARRRELPAIAFNVLLLILAVVVAWGRLSLYPI
ncbi:DoxX family protein [Streptomyces sp. NPDC053431]|uniref:DoxX family protein n=1 Tax=Streptomyces sp. NPDC053431 TaxID=3365703 RepID=UPI0037CDEA38